MNTTMRDALILSSIASNRLSVGDIKILYDYTESIDAIMQNRKDIRQVAPDATDNLAILMKEDFSEYEKWAEEEIAWCEKNKVRILTIDDNDYPQRLRHCNDAPMVLFTRGKADLNAPHIINIVGTRKCTPYGKDVIASIVRDISSMMPDIIVVSGLAYGIDITAHRAAIDNNLPTVGVVAHGQDTLYPNIHRTEANRMCLGNGAVITEYPRGTRPLPQNFLQRNRIIAGISDATIVVESAAHGGGLVTARLAQDYGREVFAIPGPVNAVMSEGTNNLIRDNKASLITSAQDIINLMMWNNAISIEKQRKAGIERQMFVDLSPEETIIVNTLKKLGDVNSNDISIETAMPISIITSYLFSLEMKGVVKALPGNCYHLIG